MHSALQTPFNNNIIRRKALKSVSFVLNEFSQIANIYRTKLTINWHKRGEQLINEKCIYDKSYERLLAQYFSTNDIIIKRVYMYMRRYTPSLKT